MQSFSDTFLKMIWRPNCNGEWTIMLQEMRIKAELILPAYVCSMASVRACMNPLRSPLSRPSFLRKVVSGLVC